MELPIEIAAAAFPQPVRAGSLVLRPLTVGMACELVAYGVDASAAVPTEKLAAVAFVLNGHFGGRGGLAAMGEFERFLARIDCGLDELQKAVETVLNAALRPYVAPRSERRNAVPKGADALTGLGWPFEVAEFLCAEYGWSFRDALATPVATAFALEVACRQRHGGRHAGLDYIERQYRRDLKSGKAKPVRLDN